MNAQSDTLGAAPADGSAIIPGVRAATAPFSWSVRRELWENRSVWFAPPAVAVLMLVAFVVSAIALPDGVRAVVAIDPARQGAELAKPYGMAGLPITLTAFLVGVFYCLGALHNERRDRSILFWKSLPVSDLQTVLAKASIPLVVLPLITCATIVAVRAAMLLLGSAALLVYGLSPAVLWTNFPLMQLSLVPLYGTLVQALWYAPIYGWLLMVSAWAKRAPFLWAVLPPLALCLFEKIAFNTTHLASLIGYRLMGSDNEAFAGDAGGRAIIFRLEQLDPGKFLATPGLWLGLAVAAAFLAAAVWLRRTRETI